ncbi:hypothetical protein H0I64_04935 [Yersinia kristensenii]|uniref:beta/gamma crystallin domain-containing protein n=2 Tax=Yersinia kristensenii TaxID=28152 RepID=UPI001C60C960|nr:beta/gamma crystallin domain-containing protein [Yersinia kristensenii]MBW5815623.1 hypothetical protein [Yersinia kristensenii]
MNKFLFLYILATFYSESAKANDFSVGSIENILYFHHKESAPACFYTEDKFQGESFCLTAPEAIDLYHRKDNHLNDRVSSIKIPAETQVTIYKNDHFNLPGYTLTESVDLAWLKKMDMAGQISAIKTRDSPGFCMQDCVVIKENKIDLNRTLGKYDSEFGEINKLILMNFDINNESNFGVGFIDYPQIIVVGKDLFFYTAGKSEPLNMKISDNADNLSLLFKLNDQGLGFQYLEAEGTAPLNTPFWINTQYSSGNLADLHIINGIPDNDQGNIPEDIQPLILNKTIMAINKHSHRDKRGALGIAGCVGIPLLAIYNLVVQGRCNQLDKLVGASEFSHHDGEGKTQVVAGSATPLPMPEVDSSPPLDNIFHLTDLNTHLHHQALTLPAVAKICRTSVEDILAARYPRSPDENCPRWVLPILMDFTLLFGHSIQNWTQERLGQILTQIAETGSTGYASNAPETEDRLVIGVRDAIQTQGITEATQQITRAFHYSRLNYANYLSYNTTKIRTPVDAQKLPLGKYSLPLESYHYPTEPPGVRLRENNQWVDKPDLHFQVEIIDGIAGNREAIARVHSVMKRWYSTYISAPLKTNRQGIPMTDIDRTTSAARTTSASLLMELEREASHYLFVVVRLGDEIISVQGAVKGIYASWSHGDDDNDYYIEASVTAPLYVLTPEAEGNIRGAGTAAVHELARYLKEHGVKTLRSTVISQPSAKVKMKLGFHHNKRW